MSNIAKIRGGAVTQFEPSKSHARIAAFDAVRRHAQAIQDWPALAEAVREQIAEQKEFRDWWDNHVSIRQHNKVQTDRAGVSVAEAEKETKITQRQVSRWRKSLKDEDKYTAALIGPSYKKAMGDVTVRGTEGTGENEWYTPAEFIEHARAVLGEIDLDPASNLVAQHVVKAAKFFTPERDGLKQDWHGRVWLNPPYAQPFIAQFVTKLIAEINAGRVTNAILLTHNYTDTAWFHEIAGAVDAICFTRGRIKFYEPDGEVAAPTQGQAFSYFGLDVDRFKSEFEQVGFVMVRS